MVQVRRATIDDWHAISSFIQDTYGLQAPFKGATRWRWQFVDNPFRPVQDDGPAVWIAEAPSGAIAGQIAVQDGRLCINGGYTDAGWIVDVMIRPEFRGQGIGHRIHEAVMRERPCLFTLTMAPATRRIAEAAGCLTLGPTWQLIRPLKLDIGAFSAWVSERALTRQGMMRSLTRPPGSVVGGMALGALLIPTMILNSRGLQKPASKIDAVELSHHDAVGVADELTKSARSLETAGFDKGRQFFDWRFGSSTPDLAYSTLALRQAGSLIGYTVVREPHMVEHPIGIIAEAVHRPGDYATAGRLIDVAVERLAPTSVCIEMATTDPIMLLEARKRGFFTIKTMNPTVVVEQGALRDAIAQKAHDFRFSKADHDWDQIRPRQTT